MCALLERAGGKMADDPAIKAKLPAQMVCCPVTSFAQIAHTFVHNVSVFTTVIISSFSELCCLHHGAVVNADCAAIYRPSVAVHGQQRGYETMQAAVKTADSCSNMTHAHKHNIAPVPWL